MHLSVLIATNRPGLLASSRIAQACSWAGPNVEVIIRDNSTDAHKRALLPQFQRDNCTIILAEPCDMRTNILEILGLAKGEFIFIMADDDFCFDHAMPSLARVIEEHGQDRTVVGITGAYAIETSQGSAITEYQNTEADDVTQRITGYLNYSGPNILLYAPIRRHLVQRMYGFLGEQPYLFSFHDQIVCMLYLLNGKFVRLKRLLYLYDVGPWEQSEGAQKRDVSFYADAGFDPAINKLHWFLCAFEGAALVRNSDLFPDIPMAQRQTIADLWFFAMYQRFTKNPRLTFDSRFTGEADKLCANFRQPTGQMSFQNMLTEVSNFMALSSKDHAQRYFDFWNAIIERTPAARLLAAGDTR